MVFPVFSLLLLCVSTKIEKLAAKGSSDTLMIKMMIYKFSELMDDFSLLFMIIIHVEGPKCLLLKAYYQLEKKKHNNNNNGRISDAGQSTVMRFTNNFRLLANEIQFVFDEFMMIPSVKLLKNEIQ